MQRMAENGKKQIVVFLRDHLAMGGIETYIYDQAKIAKERGHQVVWIKHPNALFDESFEKVFFDGSTVVLNKKRNTIIDFEKIADLVTDADVEIKIIAFDVHPFVCAEAFKSKFRACPVHTFYFVPNYVGATLYPEESYRGKKKERVREKVAPIMRKMHFAGNIRYFSHKHFEKMMAAYEYDIENLTVFYVPPREYDIDSFDEERCRRLFRREEFNLLSVTRFDFPHKGYLLGLIKAYAEVKNEHPELKMTIVGYGKDENKVTEWIASLDENARKDIHLTGKASPEQLIEYYNDANLNISVAGCCTQGAKNGTLSIPARHFNYDGEVYGFLPESKLLTVSDIPGEPAAVYIKRVLEMSEEEYCARCRDSFEAFRGADRMDRIPMERIENVSNEPTLSEEEIRYMFRMEKKRILRSKIRGVIRETKKVVGKLSGMLHG